MSAGPGGGLGSAAALLRRGAMTGADVAAGLRLDAAGLAGAWDGTAATACLARLEGTAQLVRAGAVLAEEAADTVQRAASVPAPVGAPGGAPAVGPAPGWLLGAVDTLCSRARGLGAEAHAHGAAALVAAAPRAGDDPLATRAWWDALPAGLRGRLAGEAPGTVSDLVGLPLDVRAATTERLLRDDLAGLEHALATRPLTVDEGRRLLAGRATSDALAAVRGSVDPGTGRPRTASLLAYDAGFADGEGRAAVAVGDVAQARHVAVLVPGLGADVPEDLGSLVEAAGRVADSAALAAAPREPVAVVAWLGYDAPSLLTVASTASAEAGALLLARDLRGVEQGRATSVHLTLVGHSYGSLTAARAAAVERSPHDDLVLLGSPGVGAERADELGAPGHVFVGADSRDPVSYLGWFGPDPAAEGFGAVRLRAESAGPDRWDLDAHSSYDDAGSEALRELGLVVAGRAALARPALPRQLPRQPWQSVHDPERDRRSREVSARTAR